MKRVWLIVFALFTLLFNAGTVPAETLSVSTPNVKTLEGIVASADTKEATPWVKIKSLDGVESAVALDPSTTVWKEGKAAALSEVKAGSRVTVRYLNKNGKDTAKSIEIA